MGRVRDLIYGEPVTASDTPPPPSPVDVKLAAARAARAGTGEPAWPAWVTRDSALRNSVVNRARDLIAGTFAALPLTRVRVDAVTGAETDLGPGWLERPDPSHTRGRFVADVTDDLFFYGAAYAQVTARDTDGKPRAMRWLPVECLMPTADGTDLTFTDDGRNRWPALGVATVGQPTVIAARDVIAWESPLDGILVHGGTILATAARLEAAANRFAGAEVAAGWLRQVGGEPLDATGAQQLVDAFAAARQTNTIAYLNETLEYSESQMDPDRLQLIQGRAYSDAAVARLCNVPNYFVGVGVPNDSMTYRTAATARLDLIDFGLAPFLAAWQQALSADTVTPHGTVVRFDLEPFLRTKELAALPGGGTPVVAPPASTDGAATETGAP